MYKRLVVLFVILITTLSVPVVDAHSPIERRVPNVNEVLTSIPDKVEVIFKDPVQIHRSSVIVRNAQEQEVQAAPPRLDPKDNRHIIVDLQKRLPSGAY